MTQLHFLDILSFGTICNAVHCTVFPEKGTLCLLLFFFTFWGLPFSWLNFKRDIHYKRGRVDLKPSFHEYSSSLQIVLCWMLANLTDVV